jgi:4-hydroxy-2-oxoheptanedioate aldolase
MKQALKSNGGIKARLRSGRPALCCLANMGSAVAAEILGRAGYCTVMIDMEHGPGDTMITLAQLQALAATPAAALVRVPENAPVHLKRVLDAGPAGVMVPAVSTRAEAERAVAFCRYPPRGIRGVAHPIARASGYGTDLERYMRDCENDLLVICQIETMDGVKNAASIARTDGVDMIFVGPMDLSASAGYFNQPDHPAVAKLVARVEAEVSAAGKLLGGLATAGNPAAALFERGYDLVIDAIDIALIRDGAQRNVEAARKFTARSRKQKTEKRSKKSRRR